jgi:hypothetical protein
VRKEEIQKKSNRENKILMSKRSHGNKDYIIFPKQKRKIQKKYQYCCMDPITTVPSLKRPYPISKVESVTKMAARSAYQQMRQVAYESICTYIEQQNSTFFSRLYNA